MKPINPGSNPEQSLNPCNPKSPLQENLNIDPASKFCRTDSDPATLRDVEEDLSWLENKSFDKTGFGFHKQCDPMQAGLIQNDLMNPNRTTIYRYSNGLRGFNEAMQDLFSGLVVRDDNGKYHPVPIVYAVPEKAVAAIMQDNIRKDNSGVVDSIRLPLLTIYQSDIQPDWDKYAYHQATNFLLDHNYKPGFYMSEKRERDTVFGVARGIPIKLTYTLSFWTYFIEDADQILEQILLKFSRVAYIQVQGVHWETIVTLDSISNNIEPEPGVSQRAIKYQFTLTVESYLPQPIKRFKSVLETKIDVFNSLDPNEVNELLAKLEDAVEDLK